MCRSYFGMSVARRGAHSNKWVILCVSRVAITVPITINVTPNPKYKKQVFLLQQCDKLHIKKKKCKAQWPKGCRSFCGVFVNWADLWMSHEKTHGHVTHRCEWVLTANHQAWMLLHEDGKKAFRHCVDSNQIDLQLPLWLFFFAVMGKWDSGERSKGV